MLPTLKEGNVVINVEKMAGAKIAPNFTRLRIYLLLHCYRSNSYGCGADDVNFGISFEQFPLAGVHVISSVRFQSPAHQVYLTYPLNTPFFLNIAMLEFSYRINSNLIFIV